MLTRSVSVSRAFLYLSVQEVAEVSGSIFTSFAAAATVRGISSRNISRFYFAHLRSSPARVRLSRDAVILFRAGITSAGCPTLSLTRQFPPPVVVVDT